MASIQKMFSTLIVLVFAILSINSAKSLKILGLFPHPGLSHFHFFHPIMRGLAEAGHDVTVVGHFPDKNPPPNYKDLVLAKTDLLTNSVDLEWFSNRPWYQPFMEFFMLYNWGVDACELTLNSTVIKNILNTKQKYDVILMEQFNAECMNGVAWKLNVPTIGMSSCAMMPWHYERFSNPWILSYISSMPLGFSDNMSYTERLMNFVSMNAFKLMYKYITLPENDRITRKYLRDDSMPHVGELAKQTSLMFVNTHFSLEGAKPWSPQIIELGGIHIKESKELDVEIKSILDSANDGVIYVSWGSMIRAESLPEQKRNSLLKAFGTFKKQQVIWKWENETLPNQPDNVFIRKWLPQKKILCHPNVRVFVSHSGLMGSSEAAYCGVPMVMTPMYGDQFHNSAVIKARGMGSIVHYEDINEETITAAIREALSDEVMSNAKKVSYTYRNRPRTPLETAIWWTEYVAATQGAPLLKSPSMNMSTIAYYSFDVYATIVAVFGLVIFLPIYVICKSCRKSVKSKTE